MPDLTIQQACKGGIRLRLEWNFHAIDADAGEKDTPPCKHARWRPVL